MRVRIVKLFFITFTLTINHLFGQIPNNIFNEITGEKFDPKDFAISKHSLKQNIGVYHFGESEAEWDLVFIPYKDSFVIQVWYGIWAEEPGFENQTWLNKCQTYNNVKINGNKFYFGDYSGQFVEYKDETTKTNAVLLFSDPIQGKNYRKGNAQVGFYTYSVDTFFEDEDRYQLSIKIQPETFFANKTKQELKVLRNTIFANYGLIFQKGGETETYFTNKEWYIPFQKDVSNYVTAIERKNLETLKRFE